MMDGRVPPDEAADPAGESSPSPPRIAAIVRHADEPDLLKRWLRHHLSLGIDHIFVAVAEEDAETDRVLDAFRTDPRIRQAAVDSFAADPFSYVSDAVGVVVDWCTPDWLLFCDSDEIYITATGRLHDIAGLIDQDVLVVERYNTPPLRERDGTIRPPNFTNPAQLPMIVAASQDVEAEYLAGRAEVPCIMARQAPKLLVHADMARHVGSGGRSIGALPSGARSTLAGDAVILRVPFSTERRFRQRIQAAREQLANGGDRVQPYQAWYWQYWLALPEEQLGAEFARQAVKVSAIPMLAAQGVLTTPAEHFLPERQARTASAAPERHKPAERTVVNRELVTDDVEKRMPGSGDAETRMEMTEMANAALAQVLPLPDRDGSLRSAPVRHVARVEECYFYHTMDIPGIGVVQGQWDLRSAEQSYLGGIPLAGRSVLEIGTASGHLAFWMEQQGATVTAFDLDQHQNWDLVPFAGLDQEVEHLKRKTAVELINNSWWFARERFGSSARCVYGTVYELGGVTERFDIVAMNSVLLHLRDPFLALQRAAALSHDTIVVTDVAEHRFFGYNPLPGGHMGLYFLPRAEGQGPTDCWWCVPETTVVEFLRILGFPNIEVSHHKQRFMSGEDVDFYTVVGRRAF